MAKRNIEEYSKVLSILDTPDYKDKDGFIKTEDIETVFVAISDKVRTDTIRAHINKMCALKLFTRKGDTVYKIAENWKDTIKKFE